MEPEPGLSPVDVPVASLWTQPETASEPEAAFDVFEPVVTLPDPPEDLPLPEDPPTADSAPQPAEEPKRTRRLAFRRTGKRRWWRTILDFLVIALCAAILAALLKAVAFRAFEVPSESMHPTLMTGDRIIAEMISPRFDAYKRGDVVVFRDTGDWIGDGPADDEHPSFLQMLGIEPESTGYIVKRILAVPGETVEGLGDGTILINGEKLEDSYAPRSAQQPFTWTLSDGEYWMMGDNRAGSADSRMHGPVNGREFVGRVVFTFFPFDRAGTLS